MYNTSIFDQCEETYCASSGRTCGRRQHCAQRQSYGPSFCENMEFSVCVARNSETIGTADLYFQGYIVQGVNLCT